MARTGASGVPEQLAGTAARAPGNLRSGRLPDGAIARKMLEGDALAP
jgi:hypothetical protein